MAPSLPDAHTVFPAVVNTIIDVVLVGDDDQCGCGTDHSDYQDYRSCFHRRSRAWAFALKRNLGYSKARCIHQLEEGASKGYRAFAGLHRHEPDREDDLQPLTRADRSRLITAPLVGGLPISAARHGGT